MTAPRGHAGVASKSGRHRREHPHGKLVRSSLFLMGSTALSAVMGAGFWFVVARAYSPAEVGTATSLISAAVLISYLSLFGMNTTVMRFRSVVDRPNVLVSQAILVVGAGGLMMAIVYVLIAPTYEPALQVLHRDLSSAAFFVVAATLAGLNLLTDAVFVSARVPEYNVLIDGLMQSAVKLGLPLLVVGSGAIGIFGAAGAGYLVAVVVSVLVMQRRLGFRFVPAARRPVVTGQFSYSAQDYVSNVFNIAPTLALPLIALHEFGPERTGYFYLAFQVATLLYAIAYAIGESLLSEAAHDQSRMPILVKRSLALCLALIVPAAIIVAAGAPTFLRLFGGEYAVNGRALLEIFALSAVPVAMKCWANFLLKLRGQMKALIASNLAFAIVTLATAATASRHGLVWLGWAWCAGNVAGAVVAATAALLGTVRLAMPQEAPVTRVDLEFSR